MDRTQPFWRKVANAIANIQNRTFKFKQNYYVLSGNWSSASGGHIRRLLIRCGAIESGLRMGQVDTELRDSALRFCKSKQISFAGNRFLYVVNDRRIDEINCNLLLQNPKLELQVDRERKAFSLHFANEATMPLRDTTWYQDPF